MINARESDLIRIAVSANYVFSFSKHYGIYMCVYDSFDDSNNC